ncbi:MULTISPECIES: DUF5680 domain-containing protein [Enterobacterales]|jgi:hypothetical protein|uniref:DUF5680 domain-containing protein n=1 Tax=Rahnella sp. (strain Y9602) TaxID=2703885 RepID=A0ABW6CBB1_RAHSY|nr:MULTISPECIES: DUF5680 domain-containing protein [Enterobacterales]AZP42436.1 hypothetical protein EJP79_11505 [Rahnella aquatilis]EEW2384047.1 hypothetical protein [Escherichia coli]AZP46776.1 hypothetical protein EJP81_11510 [Rahnella aquatilis]EFB4723931.1 hypothetical protein [Escherichia coli]EFD0292864.1 hypothetical protein [Escherichia coli]
MEEFLIKANRFLYRNPENVIIKSLTGGDMKVIEYNDGGYTYRNYFTEGRNIYGQVIISFKKFPIWVMQYQGGATNDRIDEITIRKMKSLSMKNQGLADELYPIRGPRENKFSGFFYSNTLFGSIQKFQGQETIQFNDETYYSLILSGGVLV